MGRLALLDNIVNSTTGQVEGYCIVKSVSEKVNKNGAAYLDFVLIDAYGEISAKLWDYDKNVHGTFSVDNIVKVRGVVNQWREAEQLRIDRIRLYNEATDDIDMTKLVPCSPYDSDWMLDEIKSTVNSFKDKELTRLVMYMLERKESLLLFYPAALKLHHALRGGLLYHSFTMLKLAREICKIYPALDSDLVYAGIILHDLAKIDELMVGETGLATGYSSEGQLIGHLAMGAADIECACKELGINDELRMLMEHIVLAHHSVPEFGSPKPPMFPEAEVVATVDVLDARMYEMFDVLDSVVPGGFSERQWALENRMLYKHRHNQD